ncbi:MAG: sulfurtransferase-like selenium metabolism protein YedF [Deltaproteobacteria bacterium]|nr:sulfurtransferase-like selenium metabolism protein YedF [Deltaproteobacteria bacterium]
MPVIPCQGLACPHPVLETRKVVLESRPFELAVLVDNEAARDNVVRFLSVQGYEVTSVIQDKDEYRVEARDARTSHPSSGIGSEPSSTPAASTVSGRRILILLTRDVLGSGDDTLGAGLMKNFLATLPEMGSGLWRLVLVNSAVRLAVENSPVLDSLQTLERSGVSILVCGTCLNFFELLERKRVGETTNMLDVVTSLDLADKVVTV